MYRLIRIMPTTVMGTFSQNSQCHETLSSSQPLYVGPMAGASMAEAVHSEMAMAIFSRGMTWYTIAIVIGEIMPVNAPCRMRNAMSDSTFQARAQQMLTTVKPVMANRKSRL